jgi:hypothetical protein
MAINQCPGKMKRNKPMKFRLFIVFISALLTGAAATAQDVNIEARLDTGAMLIGDHVGLKLSFNGPSNAQVIWPSFGDTILGNILVIGRSKIDTSLSADKKHISLRQEINLTCYDSGFYTIPQIPVKYRLLPDTSVRTTSTGLIVLMVHTVKVDTTIAIKPIKGPLHIPISFREILPYLLLALAVIALIFGLIWFINKRKKHEPLIQLRPKVKLLPHEKALQDLEKLRIKKLWQGGHVKQYYSELTDILRLYIEQGFEIPALESTTVEIMEELNRKGIFPGPVIERIDHILRIADMVKFAKLIPVPGENEQALEGGIDFVRNTIQAAVKKSDSEMISRQNQNTQL